ncbi:MAG: hypothetical protein GQ532_16270 [Methylomarinum sp.]|nr:hypothetical protein [Methylomarinum sp.]
MGEFKSRKREMMISIVGLWQISHKRKQDFCKEHQVSMSSLDYWRRQYNKIPKTELPPVSVESFTKISSPKSLPEVPTSSLELEYPNGVKLKVSSSDMDSLQTLIKLWN